MAKQILVIDDDHVVRELLKTILEDSYDVLLARGAGEGLNMLSDKVGLVFLDYKLPDTDGLEALRQIRRKYASLPVIFITAYGSEEVCQTAYRTGTTDYIKKPFNVEEIRFKAGALMNSDGRHARHADNLTACPTVSSLNEDIPDQIACNIIKVKRYIDEHYNEQISLPDAAKMACMSKTSFCSHFKRMTGCTFGDYSDRVRFEHAQVFLKNRNLSVQDISMELGYSSVNYFIAAFKKMSGMSPAECRKQTSRERDP